jgi:hypothetical protein
VVMQHINTNQIKVVSPTNSTSLQRVQTSSIFDPAHVAIQECA